jgi:hypothetical protein
MTDLKLNSPNPLAEGEQRFGLAKIAYSSLPMRITARTDGTGANSLSSHSADRLDRSGSRLRDPLDLLFQSEPLVRHASQRRLDHCIGFATCLRGA